MGSAMSEESINEPQSPPSVYDHLAMVIQQMAHVSWQKLGLQHDTITGKLEQNLSEAKVAIDVVAQLIPFLEPQLDPEDRRQLHSMLRDLRINFVQKTSEGSTI
jgi:hypothetical protein